MTYIESSGIPSYTPLHITMDDKQSKHYDEVYAKACKTFAQPLGGWDAEFHQYIASEFYLNSVAFRDIGDLRHAQYSQRQSAYHYARARDAA